MTGSTPPREQLARWFGAVLAELDPCRLLRERLRGAPPLDRWPRILILAFGKAAVPMLAGWLEGAGADAARDAPRLEIVLAGPGAASGFGFPVQAFVPGHPEPNLDSLRAGAAMLAAARRLAAGSGQNLLVALISGGGSAMVEWPLGAESAAGPALAPVLDALRRRNRALVHSGASIADINLIRKHLSAVKGGRLAAAAAGIEQQSWILSDVPGDDPALVASGPTCPDPSTAAAAAAAFRRWLPHEAPPPFAETPKPGDAAFARARWELLAGNREACAALAAQARAAGCDPVVVDPATDEAELEPAAAALAARWRGLRAASARPCLIAGGEVRVHVPDTARGRGGRNQQLALRIALELAGEDFTFLSAGTDGVDGSSDAAGALVDGGTVARGLARGLDAAAYLRDCNAHAYFEATGELLRTGPTGNNLRDLRCFLPGA